MTHYSDDNLKEVLKSGLLEPSSDFTAIVMNRVDKAVTPGYNQYKPLISMKGWMIIGTSVLILFLSCLMVLLRGGYTKSVNYLDFLDPLIEKAGTINLSINIESVVIGLMVFATIAILFFADLVFKTSIDPETGFQGN